MKKPKAYYNEIDPKAAAILVELIADGQIAPGTVDTRSIEDVTPNDLRGYTQCHFFAGIGGWSVALRLAGVSDARPIWTGSCPCQPFSTAGKGLGFDDERHLWPAFYHLIRLGEPELVFGEQVAKALPWYDLVSRDLEAEGYTVGATIVGAHSVGAPHIRQRLYWLADRDDAGLRAELREELQYREWQAQRDPADGRGSSRTRMADDRSGRREVASESAGVSAAPGGQREAGQSGMRSEPGHRLGDASSTGTRRNARGASRAQAQGQGQRHRDGRFLGNALIAAGADGDGLGDDAGPQGRGESGDRAGEQFTWASGLVHCTDGVRPAPIEPEFFPLVNGLQPDSVAILRGAGNAIVPQVAAAFIKASLI